LVISLCAALEPQAHSCSCVTSNWPILVGCSSGRAAATPLGLRSRPNRLMISLPLTVTHDGPRCQGFCSPALALCCYTALALVLEIFGEVVVHVQAVWDELSVGLADDVYSGESAHVIGVDALVSRPIFQRRPSTHYMYAQEVHIYNNRIEISKPCLYKAEYLLY
jgi:hypothetical protein